MYHVLGLSKRGCMGLEPDDFKTIARDMYVHCKHGALACMSASKGVSFNACQLWKLALNNSNPHGSVKHKSNTGATLVTAAVARAQPSNVP